MTSTIRACIGRGDTFIEVDIYNGGDIVKKMDITIETGTVRIYGKRVRYCIIPPEVINTLLGMPQIIITDDNIVQTLLEL